MWNLQPVHKFILRNNGLLTSEKLANFLGVNTDTVLKLKQDMGLPDMKPVQAERAIPIISRRNHDILSDTDIAKLMEISDADYVKTLQEMDFLSHKLGSKPEVFPEISAYGDERTADISAKFRDTMSPYMRDYSEWELPFCFLEQFKEVETKSDETARSVECQQLRMMYSYTGTHGDFLLTGEDFLSDGILSRLSNRGVNAVWMPALLRDLASSDIFPEFGSDCDIRIENLRKQVGKALDYGIKIYLYFNEPRYMPEAFFYNYPNAKGEPDTRDKSIYGMCTSDQSVRQWMFESSKYIFKQIPDLGGVILITASENRTNCYSHAEMMEPTCPRCRERGAAEVLSDTANIIADAVRDSGSDARVIQWLWGWDFSLPRDEVKDAIACLSTDVAIMVDWARWTKFDVFGKAADIVEYTLAYTKPSDYAKGVIDKARMQNRRVYARASIVTTVEGNALPYLPLPGNVADVLREVENQRVDGILGCWIFGAYPGRNMEMLLYANHPDPARIIAENYYGKGAEYAMEAWDKFACGMKFIPTSVPVLYLSALNPGPGLRFTLEPEPWRHGMVAMASENLDAASEPFGLNSMIRGFRESAKYFAEGIEYLRKAIDISDKPEHEQENIKDLGICGACLHHFLSVANYSDFISTRNQWLASRNDSELKTKLISLMRDELSNAEEMLVLVKNDSRIGYEGSIGYFYTPIEIVEKIYDLRCNIEKLEACLEKE